MSVILVGYRGSGKSTVGLLLAQRLSLPLLDTDSLLVARAGTDIRTIFSRHGEAHFRALETEALVQALSAGESVLSAGGGIILRDENRRMIKTCGRPVVYLHGSPEPLLARINADASSHANRPSLTALGGDINEVRQLIAQRDPLYREVATMVVDVDTMRPEEVASRILATIKP